MIRTERLIESHDADLDLTESQAASLSAIGSRLASRKAWWGSSDDNAEAERSVVPVRPLGSGRWRVRVVDCVGVVSIGDLQLVIGPKIPSAHLFYLLAKSGAYPRLDDAAASVAAAPTLWDLVARWFVDATERLLRVGLVRDYVERIDALDAVAGSLELQATTGHYYSGRLAVECRFDEFGYDTPLNRVLLAALAAVAGSPALPDEARRRSLRLMARFEEVEALASRDLSAEVDRRTSHYRTAHALARHIIRGLGREIAEGADAAWTFLIRTPELVEGGIREVLAERLGRHRVTKQGLQLAGTTLTFNPDLVFDGGRAVGDVKYKVSSGEWSRPDLYQTIAFAEAFGASHGVVVRFRHGSAPAAPSLVVGTQSIREATWPADVAIDPDDAADELADSVLDALPAPALQVPA